MTSSYSATASKSYTRSNARYVASKVRTDLQQLQRWYGEPSDKWIDDYHDELVILSAGRYVDQVTYGFKRDGRWVLTLEYTFRYDGTLSSDDRAGGVRQTFDPPGAYFTSYLRWSSAWSALTSAEKDAVRKTLPFIRTTTGEPQYAAGRYASDRTYSVDGSGASRRMFIPS
jgi:hypothetical protein